MDQVEGDKITHIWMTHVIFTHGCYHSYFPSSHEKYKQDKGSRTWQQDAGGDEEKGPSDVSNGPEHKQEGNAWEGHRMADRILFREKVQDRTKRESKKERLMEKGGRMQL